jgi:beta-lactam-binding protein with PASTA domain
MSDDNNFLKSYGEDLKKTQDAPKGKPGYRYEEKSGFIKPAGTGGSGPSGRKPVRLLGPVLGGALVIAAIIVMVLLFSNRSVSVIDLTGWTVGDAHLWANEKGVMLQEETFYNDSYDENVVFDQDVTPGQRVKKGDFVKLSVSLGHDLSVTLPLPDLRSMTMEEVEAWADENYMTKVRITAEYSDTVPEGDVIRYEINDDTVVTEVRRDTPIYVIVSKGSEDESSVQVTVPDFRTMSVAEGFVFANENGITLTVEEQYDDYVPKGAVISQSIKADKKISRGGEIKLVVSKGKKIIIPDFSKYSKEMASTVAGQLGIPIIQTEWYSSALAGAFLAQTIKADTVYQDGDVLELKYSLSNKINVPSFVGQTRGDMEVWADELNQKGARITLGINTVMSSSPKGTITYQDKANMTISPRETIHITVSAGSLIHTPDFVGLGKSYKDAVTREIAVEMCEALNIIPDFVEEHNGDYLPGEIWYQSVLAGTEIEEGAVVTLKYNPNNNWSDVPDFIGDNKSDIEDDSDVNKKLKIVFEGSGSTVKAQSVPENTRVAYGTKVVLTLE